MLHRVQRRSRLFEFGLRRHFKGYGLILRIAFEIAEGVGSGVGLEINRVMMPLGYFEAEIVGSKDLRTFQVSVYPSARS